MLAILVVWTFFGGGFVVWRLVVGGFVLVVRLLGGLVVWWMGWFGHLRSSSLVVRWCCGLTVWQFDGLGVNAALCSQQGRPRCHEKRAHGTVAM